mgnify:FL=1
MKRTSNNRQVLPAFYPGLILLLLLFWMWEATAQQKFIRQVEYFFDSDPGYHAGVAVPVSPPTGHVTDLSFDIDITRLSDGFHQLFVRALDDDGVWGLTNQRSIYKNSLTQLQTDLTKIEYFFDSDPGFGNGTNVPFTPGGHISNLSFAIDITPLTPGFHNLFIRTRNDQGIWSLTSQKSFMKIPAETGTYEITAIEYFFDSDPGLGMGTNIPFTPSAQVEINDFVIDLTSLSPGFHKLMVRAKNQEGIWSLTNSWSLYKVSFADTTPYMVAAEYFMNSDPGFGQGTPITVAGNLANLETDVVIDISGLNPGINKLYVRTKDATGRWGQTNMRVFYKQQVTDTLPDIVFAEYFVDSDPGFGQGINVPIPAPSPHLTDLTFEVDQSQLIMGNHQLFVRTRDENGHWSQTQLDVFCRSPKPNFAANAVWIGMPTTFVDLSEFTDPQTQYFWDVNGDGITDYTYNHGFNHTYASPGIYNASLKLVSPEGCFETIVKPVYVFTCSPPSNLTTSNITTNTAVVQWTPANMEGNWSLEYGLQGFTQGSGTLISNITQTSYNILGLASATVYDVYLRSFCTEHDSSAWTGPVSFMTLEGEPCANPTHGGTIASSQVVCAGSVPEPFTSTSPASGYTGDLEYKWQISQNGVTFYDIPGATGEAYWYNNVVSVPLWFQRLARVSCETDWNGAAVSNVVQIGIEASSQYRTIATGSWTDPAVWEVYNGSAWSPAAEYPGQTLSSCSGALVTIRNGNTITLSSDVTYANIEVLQGGSLVVQQNVVLTITINNFISVHGTIIMISTAQINGAGGYYLAPGAEMHVGSAQGIYVSAMAGNIQVTGTRTFATGASYVSNGTSDQVTGDALGQNIPADVTFNTSGYTVTLTQNLVISGNITIASGVFNVGGYDLTLYGNWINQGTFVPGTSTVYFAGNANIYISVSNFYNIVFGGTGMVTAGGALTIYGNVTINNYFNAGSFTHYVYGNWVNNGTFVYGTSTINFSGSSNISVGAGAFYNVVFSGNNIFANGPLTTYGNVWISGNFNAGSYTHYVYGNWNNTGTFDPGTSTISYVSTGTVTVTSSTFHNVIFAGDGTFEAAGPLTIEGDITIEGTLDAGSYTHYVYGNWVNNGTFIYGTSTIQFLGNLNIFISVTNFYNVIFAGTGTVSATGSLTIYGDITINNYFDAGSYTHFVYGNWVNNGTFIHGTSTIHFLGSLNVTVGSTNFYHVIFDGTGAVLAAGSLTIYGDITITNYFDAGSYTHYVYGNWTNNGTFVYGTSTIHFLGSLNVFISVTNFYNVIFDGTGTVTASGSITFYGDITINNYFAAGSYTHYVYGNWVNNGTFVYGTSTIHFLGSLNITISPTNFYNVIFDGTGTVLAIGSLTFYGDITITHHFNAGSYTHFVHGNWVNNGTFVYGTSTISFVGANLLQTINGSAISTFYMLEVNKGLRSRILEVLSPISITATINNWLVITSGTFKLSYAGPIFPFYNESQAVIPTEGGFWNNGGTIIAGNFSWHVYGLIRVSAGFINIGTLSGNSLYYYSGSEINVEGGELVVATALRAFSDTHAVSFTMSEGKIIVANIGNDTGYASIWIPAPGSSFTMSGGKIIVRYNSTYVNPVDYHNVAGTVNITGGTVQFADESIGGTRIYRIGTGTHNILPGLLLVNAGVSTTVLFNNTVKVYGSVLVNAFTTLNVNNFYLWVGRHWTNYGTFLYGTGTVDFFGPDPADIGTSEFYHVIFSGSGSKVAIGSLTFYGNVTIDHHFDGGSFTHYIKGNWINNGTFVWGTSIVVFNGLVLQTIGGSNAVEFYGFTVDNVHGITLDVDITVHYMLTLTLGIITTNAYKMTLVPAAEISGGSATAYINGLLIRGFSTVGGKFFPVGNITHYRPMTFTYVSLTGTSMVEVQLIGSVIPGSIPGYITALDRYWAVSQTGGSNFTYTVTLDDEDLSNYLGKVRILKCDATITVHATTVPNYTNIDVFTTVSCVGLGVEQCEQSGIPVLSPDMDICVGGSATLEILAGNLNDAAEWVWYAGECGSNPVGTGLTLMVSPEETTTYFVRGESGCASPGLCASTIVTVIPLPEANAGADGTTCFTDAFVLEGNVSNAQSSAWSSSGDGVFEDATSPTSNYLPGEADILTGSVVLTLTAQPLSPCTAAAASQISLIVNTCHRIVIPAGWSGISTFVEPANPAMDNIFNDVIDDLIILQSMTGVYWPGENLNTIENWDIHDGYAIKVANQVELTITGTRLSDRTLQLSEGWNLIPVMNECKTNVAELFAGKGVTVVKEVAGWQLFWPQYGINTLQNLQPGAAYFVLMSNAATVTFPGCTKSSNDFGLNGTNVIMTEMINTSPWNSFNPTPNAHLIAIPQNVINSTLIRPGDYLGAFDQNGNCFGMIRWDGNNTSLALFADDPTSVEKDGFTAGENLNLRMFDVTNGKEYSLSISWDQQWPDQDGTFNPNGISAIAGLTLGTTLVDDLNKIVVMIYPNPVSDYLNVDFDKLLDVEVTLQDVNGREVLRESLHGLRNKLDIKSVPAGFYLLKIEGNEFRKIEKITIR